MYLVIFRDNFCSFWLKTYMYVVTRDLNCLNEMIQMWGHNNICCDPSSEPSNEMNKAYNGNKYNVKALQALQDAPPLRLHQAK